MEHTIAPEEYIMPLLSEHWMECPLLCSEVWSSGDHQDADWSWSQHPPERSCNEHAV